MRKLKTSIFNSLGILLAIFALAALPGCTSYSDEAKLVDSHTLVYPAKDANGPNPDLHLYRKMDKKIGRRMGEGYQFTQMVDSRIQADLELQGYGPGAGKEWLIHFDWSGPDGKTFYLKRMEIPQSDSLLRVNSSISLSPIVRDTGEYCLVIYLFRERVLEKRFRVMAAFPEEGFDPSNYIGEITLYRKKSKKTDRLIGVDSIFTRKAKRRVRVTIDVLAASLEVGRELIYRMEWIGPDGKLVYGKDLSLSSLDEHRALSSSISINPEKRPPGLYEFRVYLFGQLLQKKSFLLE